MSESQGVSPTVANTIQVPLADLQIVLAEVKHCAFNAVTANDEFPPESQPIMIDFEVVRPSERPYNFIITLLLELENNTSAHDRLSFSISTITAFEFRPNGLRANLPDEEEAYDNCIGSGINVAIGLARGYLTNYLAPTRYRDYVLPMIDTGYLFHKKSIKKHLPKVPSIIPEGQT